jgi:hypothetical protein
MQRRLACVELSKALATRGIEEQWPRSLIEASLEVGRRDIFRVGEYKRSTPGWESVIGEFFAIQKRLSTWSPACGGGDVIFVCCSAC